MIAAFVRQMLYVAERRSFAYIAREIGLPYRTVLTLRRGELDISSAFKSSIRNLYQREAYQRLRDVGYSYHEARRWSSYNPERVGLRSHTLRLKIADLAQGAVASKLRKEGLAITKRNIDSYFDEMYNKVKRGIQHSRKTTEEIDRYPFTNTSL